MLRKLLYLLLLIILFSAPKVIKATHFMGGEITWTCNGDGKYVFKVSVYRDCSGNTIGPRGIIWIHNYPNLGDVTLIADSTETGLNGRETNVIAPNCIDSTVTPPQPFSCVNNPVESVVLEYIRIADPIQLLGTPPIEGWIVTYHDWARNDLDNLAGNPGLTLRAKIYRHSNSVADSCIDNSPIFEEEATALLTSNSSFSYNHNASDKELDSLVYAWAWPLEELNRRFSPFNGGSIGSNDTPAVFVETGPLQFPDEVTFANGFDFDDPFPGTNTIDAETGQIELQTNADTGNYISVVKVTAYKCGEPVADVYREIQTKVSSDNTNNNAPLIRTSNQKFADTVKAGDFVKFTIQAIDFDVGDTFEIFASGKQFGTNFTNTLTGCDNPPCAIIKGGIPTKNTIREDIEINWQTDCNHVVANDNCVGLSNAYTFVFRAIDNGCPVPEQGLATYTIVVQQDSVIESPLINCVDVKSNGNVELDWDTTADINGSFSAWMIYSATNQNGPFAFVDSVKTYNTTKYTHIGADAQTQRRWYYIRSRSGCKGSVLNVVNDTAYTIFVDPKFTLDCIDVNWNPVGQPNPDGSASEYELFRDYPIGSGLSLYENVNGLSYCDTFSVCTDTVTYRVQLENTVKGCTSTSNTAGIRFDNPKPETDFTFSPADPCRNGSVTFNNQTTVVGGSALTYEWDFDDGSAISTEINPSHTYTIDDTYTVSLKASSGVGCDSTITKTVVVDTPTADAGRDTSVCPNGSVQIGRIESGRDPLTYKWSPSGTLNFDNIARPTASPIATTIYTVTITDRGLCTNTDQITVTVVTPPTADAGIDKDVCPNDSIEIGGSPTSSGAVTYQWSNGASLSSDIVANPKASPAVTTTYTVTVTAGANCTATDQLTVTVLPAVTADAGIDKEICNTASTIIGTNNSSGTGVLTYKWDNSGSLNLDDVAIVTASPSVTTTYTVTVTDANLCTNTDEVEVKVNDLPIVDFTYSDTCIGSATNFNGSPSGNTYSWSFGDMVGGTSADEDPSYQYAAIGSYTVKLVVTNGNNCKDSMEKTIEIKALPIANAGLDVTICNEDTAQITAANSPNYTYLWDNSATLTADNISNPKAFPAVSTIYTVTVTEIATGCTETDQVTVTVNPLPTANAGADEVICNTDSAQIGTATVAGYTYLWNNAATLSNSTIANPKAGPAITTIYEVTVTETATGCQETDEVEVRVDTLPEVDFSYVDTCLGTATQFTNLSPGTNYTSNWDFGDATGVLDEKSPAHQYLNSGIFTVKLIVTNGPGCIDSTSRDIEIKALPIVDAGLDETICDRDTIEIGSAANLLYDYSWNNTVSLSAGDISNPKAFPSSTTTYTVTVTERSTGCTNTDDVTITVNPVPVADFTYSDTCVGNPTIFDGLPNNASAYAWSFGDGLGGTSTDEDPSYQYVTTGTYTVQLVVTNGNSCKDSIEKTIEIKALPTANAGLDVTICNEDTAQIGTASNPNYIYSWDNSATLTAGNISNPKAFPSVTTIYAVNVTEIATGCSETDDVEVVVNQLPTADAGIDKEICNTDSAQIGTAAIGGYTYIWDNAATLSNSTIANPKAGPIVTTTYTVTVTETATGCVETDDAEVRVNALPVVDFSVIDTCVGRQTQFTNSSTGGNNFEWNFGDGLGGTSGDEDPTYQYMTTGDFTVKLIVSNSGTSCRDSISKSIEIKPLPSAEAGAVDTICETDTSQIGVAAVIGYTYLWDNSAALNNDNVANPKAFPAVTTVYTVTVTETATGCTNTDNVEIVVNPLPDVDFSVAATCINQTTSFRDLTNLISGSIQEWEWNFGDGSGTSTEENPLYEYANVGQYTVKLIVTSSSGCVDSLDKTIDISPIPQADFSYSDTCLNDFTQFTGLSTISSGSVDDWEWDFDNGAGSSLDEDPSFQFSNSGNFDVQLIAISALGCRDTINKTLEIRDLPTADAGVDQTICNKDTVQIGSADNPLYRYSWSNAVSLTSSTSSNPRAFPSSTTTYTVTVTENSTGCIETDEVIVTVNTLPVASFTYSDTCLGSSTQFNGSPNGNTYDWDFGDGIGTSISQNPNYTYTSSGSYDVKLLVINTAGCKDSITNTIEIKDLPLADAGTDAEICLNDSIEIGSASNSLYTYEWDNQTTLSNAFIANPKASPSVLTKYTVTVTETSTGCIATSEVTITVNPLPSADFSATKVCKGLQTQFTDLSSISAGTIQTYDWDFGDGNGTSSLKDPFYTFSNSGDYSVKLLITSAEGCLDSITKTVTVDTLPLAEAGVDRTICEMDTTTLGKAVVSGETYMWDNNLTLDNSSIAQPRAFPDVTTTYSVTVTNSNGCSSVDAVIVTVNTAPNIDAGIDYTICNEDTIAIGGAPTSTTAGVTYLWSNAGTLNDATDANPRAFPSASTEYKLTVTDAFGCSSEDIMTVNVNPLPIPDFRVDAVCEGDFAAFTNLTTISSGGVQDYLWKFGDGVGTSILRNPAYQYAAAGIYEVTHIVTSQEGCIDSISKIITINPLPLSDAGPDQEICFGDTIEIGGKPTGSITSTFSWNPGTSLSAVDIQNPLAYPLSTTSYNLSVSDINGCINYDTIEIIVNPLPNILATSNVDTVCIEDSVQLNSIGGVAYGWKPTNWLNNPAIDNPIARPFKNVEYVVFGTDVNGCINTDTVSISVFNIDFSVMDTSFCDGDSIQLIPIIQGDERGITYSWSPSNLISDNSIREPKVSPKFPEEFKLEITNVAGCYDADSLIVNLFDTAGVSFEFINSPRCSGSVLEVTNTSITTNSFIWKLDGAVISTEEDIDYGIDNTIQHTLTLIGSNDNCTDSVSKIIPAATFVELLDLKDANVFTPNGDGINDLFDPGFQGEFIGCVDFQIYDRWGAKMFDSDIGQYGWDGRSLRGVRAPVGIYYYIIIIASEEIRGSVYLNR